MTGTSPAAAPALRMHGIRKEFPGVVALDGVDLEVQRGEVHVLLGENGAGKSTLMKILSGALRKDAGEIALDGRVLEILSPRHAQQLGVGIIYQELTLVPQLGAAANVFLGREPSRRFGWLDRRRADAEAARLLLGLGVRIDPGVPVRELGIAQQQMVEVAKALSSDARLLIMDEPTSALTSSEIEQLFATIGRLTASGVAVIYISHRMDEVKRIGQRVTVMRDGRRIATHPVADVTIDELVRLMANRELKEHFPKRRAPLGEEALRVTGITRGRALRGVSLQVRRGEVVGLAGLLGAGRTELARAILGADSIDAGEVVIKGQVVRGSGPGATVARGIGLVPEDRKTQGLVLSLSVRANLALPSQKRISPWGVVDEGAEARLAEQSVAELRIKTPGTAQRVGLLSGGNQQKVVLGKWLAAGVDVLILDEPTRGIDVGSKVEIYELMNKLTEAGVAILMISSELPEILGMSDRILVMHQGRIVAELETPGATQEQVLQAALGRAS